MDWKEKCDKLQLTIDQKNIYINLLVDAMSKKTSEYKQLEEIIAYYNDIMAHLPGHVYWLNKDNIYQGCNELHAINIGLKSRLEIVGKTNFDMPWYKQAEKINTINMKVMTSGISVNIEESEVLNGVKMTFLSQKVPLRNKNNEIIGILGISVDITERKKMEEKLHKAKITAEAANQAKTAFIANMSHDIRTPLTGVVGMSQLLEDGAQNPEQKQYAHWLYDSGNQLLDMLNGILDVVSADHINENDIHEEVFDLRLCIQDLIQLELPTTTLKHLGLQVDIDKSVPQYIVSDKTKLHRILLNLLGNSIKFTKSGHITIEVKCLHDDNEQVHLQFGVADTGIGIPLALQDKVFDRFFRASPSYKGLYAGHGVGLHIAQSYITLLGGHIALTSQEGVGTTFYFDLTCKVGNKKDLALEKSPQPLQAEPAKPPALAASKRIPTTPDTTLHSSHGLHLLLVEDNAVALRMAEIIVSKAGYRFTSATTGEQALELASAHEFDLIVTDIGLPNISGHELTRRVRKVEAGLKKVPIPIIGLTAHARESAKDECLDAGMNDVFTKPITPNILQTMVNQWVSLTPDEDTADKPQVTPKLGADLPDSEDQLFELDALPLLDIKNAIENIGSESLLHEILLMVNHDILNDGNAIEDAYTTKDWETIEKLAHKLKGGAIYCGTIKLKIACQYLERYQKAGYTALLENLYHQLIQVLKDTEQAIEQWLKD